MFQDSAIAPDAASIEAALGENRAVWHELLSVCAAAGVQVQWRYYRDGGWLAKVTKGTKTIAWIAVDDGFVRVTCHFAARHRTMLIDAASLPDPVREQARTAPPGRKLLSLTVEVREASDVTTVQAVLERRLAAR